MDSSARVVVIGGGVAGLAAATYLAREGIRVTLLEKAAEIGGRAITDTPRGFALNRGAHALYSGGAASEVLRELGIRYTHGSPKHIMALDAAGFHEFPATALELFRTNLLSAADKRALMSLFVRVATLRASTFASTSIADWIYAATDHPKLRQLLTALGRVYAYSSALDLVSADVFLSKLQQTLKHPVHYIDGGWQTLVDKLLSAARAAEVQVRTSASVAEVQQRDGLACGVRLRDGTTIRCSHVLVTVPPDEAMRVLDAAQYPDLQHTVNSSVPAYIACLDLALSALPMPQHPVVFDLEQPRFMAVQSEFAQLAPEGGAVLHAFKLLDPRQPSDPRADRADLEAFLDTVQPGWQSRVVERRFLPRMLAAGVLPLANSGGMDGRVGHRSRDAANVYFAGDWVGPRGFLVDASLDSARASARLILSEPARPRSDYEALAA